jgi:exonuclease VII large subunit
VEGLNRLQSEALDPLKHTMEEFMQTVPDAPNEELGMRRAEMLDAIMGKLQQKLSDQLTEATNEEQLRRRIGEQLATVNSQLEQLEQHYSSNQPPQSLEQAKEDAQQLARLLHTELPFAQLEQVKRMPLRDQIATQQLEPIRKQIQVSIHFVVYSKTILFGFFRSNLTH